jgi:hypothetical protein
MSDAQQGLAPDCLQRVLRSRFRQQVKPGVMRTGASRTVNGVTLRVRGAQGGPREKPKS